MTSRGCQLFGAAGPPLHVLCVPQMLANVKWSCHVPMAATTHATVRVAYRTATGVTPWLLTRIMQARVQGCISKLLAATDGGVVPGEETPPYCSDGASMVFYVPRAVVRVWVGVCAERVGLAWLGLAGLAEFDLTVFEKRGVVLLQESRVQSSFKGLHKDLATIQRLVPTATVRVIMS